MPSSPTITNFYSFSPNTRARASQVNTNFSAFRGHLIPIEPNTLAASDGVHSVGSPDHKWEYGYFYGLMLGGSISTHPESPIKGIWAPAAQSEVNYSTGSFSFPNVFSFRTNDTIASELFQIGVAGGGSRRTRREAIAALSYASISNNGTPYQGVYSDGTVASYSFNLTTTSQALYIPGTTMSIARLQDQEAYEVELRPNVMLNTTLASGGYINMQPSVANVLMRLMVVEHPDAGTIGGEIVHHSWDYRTTSLQETFFPLPGVSTFFITGGAGSGFTSPGYFSLKVQLAAAGGMTGTSVFTMNNYRMFITPKM